MKALLDNLDLVAAGELGQLRRRCGVDDEDLRDMLAELRTLDPRPGQAFTFEPIQPVAPDLPAIPLGFWSDLPQLRAALEINVLFILGIVLAIAMAWMFRATRVGLIVRVVGDSTDAARAMGLRPAVIRTAATAVGGAFAGVAGAYLSLYYPGSWNEGLSSGQGLMAVALVIFARWNPIACFGAALLFGGAGALGPAPALLLTLVLLFAFQGQAILRQPLVIALLAVPILLQVQKRQKVLITPAHRLYKYKWELLIKYSTR